MADDNENFPTLPAKQWWSIRNLFKRSMPSTVTPSYLESALAVNTGTAKDLLAQLKYLRLLDTEGRPTDIAEDWRHDDTYSAACKVIREAVYPDELLHAAPDPSSDRSAAERWFARRKKVGQNAALKMAISYQLVSDANLEKAPDPSKTGLRKEGDRARPRGRDGRSAASRGASGVTAQRHLQADPVGAASHGAPNRQRTPSLHIDVQIHIAADATAEQIDQIFASMAKHLYQRDALSNE